ncbi:MAG: hypothetical protein GC192_07585 [Bacteroidetes bacterium]|nr:hypothetical protein [Bacteroidota bacterium]
MSLFDPMNPSNPVSVNPDDYGLIVVSTTTEYSISNTLLTALRNTPSGVLNMNYQIVGDLGMSPGSGSYHWGKYAYIDDSNQKEIYNFNNDIQPVFGMLFTDAEYYSSANAQLWDIANGPTNQYGGVIFEYNSSDSLPGASASHGKRVYLGYHANGFYANAQNSGAPVPVESYFNPATHLTLDGKLYFDQALVAAGAGCNAEICNNGLDDDGDGLVDCADPDCANSLNVSTNVTSPSICVGESTTISASASGGSGSFSYDWSNGLGNGISHNITPSITTTYTVTVTSSGGCTSTAQVTVTVNFCSENCSDGIDNDGDGLVDCDDSECGLGSSANVVDTDCSASNGSVTLIATGGSGTYEFSSNNTTWQSSNTFSNLSPGNYTYYIRNASGLCPRSVPFTISELCEICNDGIDNDGDGLVDCADSDCGPTATTGNDLSICLGTSTTISASASGGTSPYTYSWNNGLGNGQSKNVSPIITTTYTVTVSSSSGCSASDQITVTVTNCAENCTDGVDNDGDGLVDCEDPECQLTGAPILADDVFTSCPGVPYGNVVSMNDANLQNPIFTVITNTSNGTLILNNFGAFTYTPFNSACGVDQFTYQVCNQTTGCCAMANATINVGDNMPPTLLNVPADLTISCDDEIPIPPVIIAQDACPGIYVSMEETDDQSSMGTCGTYTITRTWSATDLCGNSTSDSQEITVQDNVKPEFFRLYTLPNGKKMVAGVAQNTSHLWKYVKFPVHFETPPVVLATVSSNNDGVAVSAQVRYVSTSGFEVRLREEEIGDKLHGAEKLSWLAIEKGNVLTAGQMVADVIPSVTQSEQVLTYAAPFPSNPVFLAHPQTTNEEDAFVTRTKNPSSSGIKVYLQEEQSKDSEINHSSEKMGYLALLANDYMEDVDGNFFGEAGQANVDQNWQTITLANTYTKPVVIVSGLSTNDAQAATIRVRNVTPTSFEVRVQEWNYLDGNHPLESVGYMVVEGGIPAAKLFFCSGGPIPLQPGINLFAIDNCDDQVAFGVSESNNLISEGLVTNYNWMAIDDCGNVNLFTKSDTCQVAAVKLKTLFSGALMGSQIENLMRDDLRSQHYLPLEEPYTGLAGFEHKGKGGGEIATQSIFDITGTNAVIDWLFVEVRDALQPKNVLATASALAHRDGTVTSASGEEVVVFPSAPEGEYVVSIRHRNHLGLTTKNPWYLSTITPPFIDFAAPSLEVLGGQVAGKNLSTGVRAMWAGDLNGDGMAIYQGPSNDIFLLFSNVIGAEENTSHLANFILQGYNRSDLNLDGKAIYQGPNNDRSLLLLNTTLSFPYNYSLLANIIVPSWMP